MPLTLFFNGLADAGASRAAARQQATASEH